MLLVLGGLAVDVAAAPPPGSPEAKKAAGLEFSEGQRAFANHDYRRAAESFEAAFRDAPHPAALWNAARAWHRANEKARAANLYAKYLRIAPPNARDRNSATDSLRELSAELARLEIHAVDVTELRVDAEALEDPSVYVTPGTHVIQGRQGDRNVRQSQTVTAGTVVSVALVGSPEEAKPPPPPPPPPPAPPKSSGLPPAVIIVGGVLTAAGAGVTIWSGLDTVNAKKAFDAQPSQAGLDAGVGKQTRTNVALGATIGLGALTAVFAAFFVDWGKKGSETKLGVGPGLVSLEQRF